MAQSTLIEYNKSQIWSLDLIIGIIIFTTSLVLFYKYGIESIDFERQDVNNLLLDAKVISNYLISEGYPNDWTLGNVTLIGLTNGNMDLNPEKVSEFSDLAVTDYAKSRKLLSTINDYYLFFEDKNNNTIRINGIEWIGKDYSTENPRNLIKVIRFVNYNSTIIRMVVYVW